MSRHPKTDLYRAERAKGKTYKEIAEQYGISHQAVAAVCCKSVDSQFRPWSADRCIYPNVRSWLNDNKVSLSEFIRRMGEVPGGGYTGRFGGYLKGKYFPGKEVIDKMLAVTGLTYEKFWEVDHA